MKSASHELRVGSSELRGVDPHANAIVALIKGLLTRTPFNINKNMNHPTNINSERIFEVNWPFCVGRKCNACPHSALENMSMHICTRFKPYDDYLLACPILVHGKPTLEQPRTIIPTFLNGYIVQIGN